jgi:hypothetical protein
MWEKSGLRTAHRLRAKHDLFIIYFIIIKNINLIKFIIFKGLNK